MGEVVKFLLAYGLIKFIAYMWWCYFALKCYAVDVKNKILAAAGFGFVRLLIGIVIGSTIAVWLWIPIFAYFSTSEAVKQLLSTANIDMIDLLKPTALVYLTIYPLIRIIEWTLMWFIMQYSLKNRLQAPSKASIVLWVLGGIIVSCVADIPLWFRGIDIQLFSGRPFC